MHKSKLVIKIFTMLILFYAIRNIFWKLYNKFKGYPSGPLGLPFFGCLFSFSRAPLTFLFNMGKDYGALSYAPLMMSSNLIISDPKILKLLYKKEKIIDRPIFSATRPEPTMFLDLNGKDWERRRKYMMTTAMTLTNSSFVLAQIKQCVSDYIEPIIDEKYAGNKKELWYPA
eukprot:275799_1